MGEQIHRDIYSGMVAEQLAKEGYFGEDINLYLFYSSNDTVEVHIETDEMVCIETLLNHYFKGEVVSNYILYKKRFDDRRKCNEQEMEKVMAQARNILKETIFPKFKKKILHYQQKNYINREPLFEWYFNILNEEQKILIPGLLAKGLREKWITKEFYDKWKMYNLANKRQFAGIAYAMENEIHYYVNSYWPNVWNLREEKLRENILCSEIVFLPVNDNKAVYVVKNDIKNYFSKILDWRYFEFLSILDNC